MSCDVCIEREEALIQFQAQCRSAIDEAKQLRSDLLNLKDRHEQLQASWVRQSSINAGLTKQLSQAEFRREELEEIIDSVELKVRSANHVTVEA